MGKPITTITCRKDTSAMAKRLQAALARSRNISLSTSEATDLIAVILDYGSQNEMSMSLKAQEQQAAVEAKNQKKGHSKAQKAGQAGTETRTTTGFQPIDHKGLVAILSELDSNLSSIDVLPSVRRAQYVAALEQAIRISGDALNRLMASTALDWVALMADAIRIEEELSNIQPAQDGQSEEVLGAMLDVATNLIWRIEQTVYKIELRTGPVHGAPDGQAIYEVDGDYGDDSNEWGGWIAASSEDEAIEIARTIMTENSGGDPETNGVEEFDILYSGEADPRVLAAKDLASNPAFNSWTPVYRAARIEIRARQYFEGAGI